MLIAIDEATDQPIWAEEVPDFRRTQSFLCPCCRMEVIFVPGERMASHFRHRRGVADEECVQYVGANTIKLNGWVLQSLLEQNVQIKIGVSLDETSSPPTLYPFAKFRPQEGNQWIRCSDPRSLRLPVTFPKSRFVALTSVADNYRFQIEGPSGFVKELSVEGFVGEISILRPSEGFWSLLERKGALEAGDYIALCKKPIDLETAPRGIVITQLRHDGLFAYRLFLADPVDSETEQFVLSIFGYLIRRRHFDCTILSNSPITYLGHQAWRIFQEHELTLLVRRNFSTSRSSPLVFESALHKYHSKEILNVSSDLSITRLGKLPVGRHVLASEEHKEILTSIEIVNGDESLAICPLQITFRSKDVSQCLYWNSEGMGEALMALRDQRSQITHFILAPGLHVEARLPGTTRAVARANCPEDLQSILRQRKLPIELRVHSKDGRVQGFKSILLESPLNHPRPSRPAKREYPGIRALTPLQFALADAARRGSVAPYALRALPRIP